MSLEEKIKLRKQGRELAEATYAKVTQGLHAEALLAFCRNMAAICEGARTFAPAQAKAFERTKCVFSPYVNQAVGDTSVQRLAALADSANDLYAYLRSDLGKARLAKSEFKSVEPLIEGEGEGDADADDLVGVETEDDSDTEDDTVDDREGQDDLDA